MPYAAGTVLFYLIRMEPFTALNRQFQGGRFDHADRLFSNVAATWDNCLHSSSDVKELTPEFYHQPEFLLNSNGFELGTQQVQPRPLAGHAHLLVVCLFALETAPPCVFEVSVGFVPAHKQSIAHNVM